MKTKNISAGEAMMRTRLAEQMAQQDKLDRKQWKRPDGNLFRFSKGAYYVVAVYSFMVYVLNELIFAVMDHSQYDLTDAERIFYRSNTWIVHSLFLLSVIAFVLMCTKKIKAACGVQIAAGGLLAVQIVQVFVGEYSNQTLLGVLYCITVLSVLAAVAMLCILAFHRKRTEKAVAKEYNKIYQRYGDPECDMMSAQQLEKAVLAYETALQEGKPLPKTVE